jgi:hypothetical protein
MYNQDMKGQASTDDKKTIAAELQELSTPKPIILSRYPESSERTLCKVISTFLKNYTDNFLDLIGNILLLRVKWKCF